MWPCGRSCRYSGYVCGVVGRLSRLATNCTAPPAFAKLGKLTAFIQCAATQDGRSLDDIEEPRNPCSAARCLIQPPERIIAQVRRRCAGPAHQPVFHVIDKAVRSIARQIAIGIITERRRACTGFSAEAKVKSLAAPAPSRMIEGKAAYSIEVKMRGKIRFRNSLESQILNSKHIENQ
ncbi:hypothetical protein MCEREM21A_02343 [Sphingomonadaceae bacterium]